MADTKRYNSVPVLTLADDLSSSGTTIKTTSMLDWGGDALTTASFNTDYIPFTIINDKKTLIEFGLITASTIGDLTTTGATIYKRGLKYFAEGDTTDDDEVTANKLAWTQGAKVLIGTNPPHMYGTFANRDNDETIDGKWTFPGGGDADAPVSGTVYSVPTDPLEYGSMQYIDNEISAIVAGAVAAFAVQQDGADPSLNVVIGSGYFMSGNTPVSFPGAAGVVMTPSTTNYVMLANDATVIVNTTGFLEDHLTLGIVTTDATDITNITDERSWLTLATDDQGITRAYVYGDTIAAGDVLYLDTADSKWKLADASAEATSLDTYGVALDAGVDTDTNKRVQIYGSTPLVSGITTAGLQYVSDTAGEVSNTVGTYKKVIGFSADGTNMIINPVQRVEDLAGSTTTTAELNQLATLIANDDRQLYEYLSNLTAGDVVKVIDDGGTMKVDNLNGVGNVANNTGITNVMTRVIEIDTDKIMVVTSNTGTNLRGIVGTISGDTVTYGAIKSIGIGTITSISDITVCKIGTDKVGLFIMGAAPGTFVTVNATVLSVSGTTITDNGPTVISSIFGAGPSAINCALISTDTVLVSHGTLGATMILDVGDMSGVSWTGSANSNIGSVSQSIDQQSMLTVDTNKAVYSYLENGTSDRKVVVISYDGAATVSAGAATIVGVSGGFNNYSTMSLIATNRVFHSCVDVGVGRQFTTLTVSGTTSSIDAQTDVADSDYASISSNGSSAYVQGRFLVFYSNKYIAVNEINANADLIVSPIPFQYTAGGGGSDIAAIVNSDVLAVAHATDSICIGSFDFDQYIGFANETLSAAETGAVNLVGNAESSQSGLTENVDVNLDYEGVVTQELTDTINSATVNNFKLGRAISATSVSLTDYIN